MDLRKKSLENLRADIVTLQQLLSKPDLSPEEARLHRDHIEQLDAEITRRNAAADTKAKRTPFYKKPWFILLAIFAVLIAVGNYNRRADYESASPEQRRKIDIEQKVFVGSGGSVPALVAYIKNGMNDPASFEHVKTTYREEDGHLYVVMHYRGKNAFNATITKMVGARVDLDGAIIEVVNE